MVPPTKINYYFQIVKDGETPFPVRFEDDLKTHETFEIKEVDPP